MNFPHDPFGPGFELDPLSAVCEQYEKIDALSVARKRGLLDVLDPTLGEARMPESAVDQYSVNSSAMRMHLSATARQHELMDPCPDQAVTRPMTGGTNHLARVPQEAEASWRSPVDFLSTNTRRFLPDVEHLARGHLKASIGSFADTRFQMEEAASRARATLEMLNERLEDKTLRFQLPTLAAAQVAGWNWSGDKPVAHLAQSICEIMNGMRANSESLRRQMGEITDSQNWLGATSTIRLLSGMHPALAGLDAHLLGQSFAAASLVEAHRFQPDALADIRGRSALVDAMFEVDSFLLAHAEGSDDAAWQDTEEQFADLMGRIVATFHAFLLKARSAYERESLLNILTFMVALVFGILQTLNTGVEDAISDQGVAVTSRLDRIEEAETNRTLAQDTTNTQLGRVVEVLESIKGTLSEHRQAADAASDRYVVIRAVPLKERRSMKSPTLSTLQPNQVVSLLRRDEKWVEVEYFDYLANETRIGWTMIRHLKRLER